MIVWLIKYRSFGRILPSIRSNPPRSIRQIFAFGINFINHHLILKGAAADVPRTTHSGIIFLPSLHTIFQLNAQNLYLVLMLPNQLIFGYQKLLLLSHQACQLYALLVDQIDLLWGLFVDVLVLLSNVIVLFFKDLHLSKQLVFLLVGFFLKFYQLLLELISFAL